MAKSSQLKHDTLINWIKAVTNGTVKGNVTHIFYKNGKQVKTK